MLCIPKQVVAYTTASTPMHISAHAFVIANPVHFLKYENSTYGIRMQYPSNWQKIGTNELYEKENLDNYRGNVEFRFSSLPTVKSNVDESTLSVSIHKLPTQNIMVNLFGYFHKTASPRISLEGFVLSHLTSLLTKLPNFHLIGSESGEATLADNTPAHKLVYEYREQGQKNKGMEILIVKDDTGYIFRYIAEEPRYLIYLPVVQEIVNTAEIDP